MRLAEHRERVASAARELASRGLVLGTAGNVSARDGDLVAVTPTGGVLGELTADQVCVVDLEGAQVDGTLEPTSELDLHLGVLRRYESGSVVHTHSPMATALSCVLDEVPCVHYSMLALGGTVPVAPYTTFGTPELAESVVNALEGHTGALMANHGAVTHAATVEGALDLTLLLEWACSVYWHASLIGSPRALDTGEREAVIAAVMDRGYGSTRQAEDAA